MTTATRRGFERIYDLPERVLPAAILERADALRGRGAAPAARRCRSRPSGIASERCLRDYFRIEPADAKARIPELVEAGELLPVTVDGWNGPVYLDPEARLPRSIDAQALLSPFDPIVWERTRTERLFDFRYRIEIYTPADKRRVRLLLPALPPWRDHRGAARSQGRPGDRTPSGAFDPSGSERLTPDDDRAGARRRTAPHGGLARPDRYRGPQTMGEAAGCLRPQRRSGSPAPANLSISAAMQFLIAPATRLWLRLRLNEIGPLLSLAGFGFCAWAFIAIADEVREGETQSPRPRPAARHAQSSGPRRTRSVPAGSRRRRATSPALAATRCLTIVTLATWPI